MKPVRVRFFSLTPWLLLAGMLVCEPLLANKFETIGGGVQGSTQIKAEYLQIIAYITGGIFLAAGVLAILLHDKNAHTLNYTLWKSSSAIFFLLSVGCFVAAVLMH